MLNGDFSFSLFTRVVKTVAAEVNGHFCKLVTYVHPL